MTDLGTAICAGPDCDDEFEKSTHNHKYCSTECKRDAENVSRRRQYTRDVADALASSVASAYMEMDVEEQVDFLRRENGRLNRAATKYKAQAKENYEAIYQAAYDTFGEFELPYTSKPPPKKRSLIKDEEVAVAVLADLQLGKKTPTYNSDICAERIDLYAEKILKFIEIYRSHHPVNKVHIWALGDIVEGEDIFAGQPFHIDSSLYTQVGVAGPEILSNFVLRLLEEVEQVHFVGIIGNHGWLSSKSRKNYNPETNMDRLLYKILEYIFANDDRVTFNIPDGAGETNFYAVDTIGSYGTLLLHGDQFPPPTSNHTYYKKVMGWKDGAIPEDFTDVFLGHYHQNVKMTLGNTTLRIAPSPESYNTYAQEVLAVMGRPAQHLQFVHPVHGVTSEHTIYLDD